MKNILKKLSVVVFLTLLSSCSMLGEETRVDKEFTVSDDISIKMGVGGLTVGVSSDEKVHLTYYEYNIIKYDIEHNTGKLVLTQHVEEKNFTGSVKGVTILIPTTLSGDLRAELGAGNITVSDSTVTIIDLHSDAGNITVSGAVTSIDLSSDAGDITVENSAVTKNITMYTEAGNIELDKLQATGDITMYTEAGNITGSIVGNENDFTIKTSSKAGNVSPSSGGTGNQQLTATTEAGNINITFTP